MRNGKLALIAAALVAVAVPAAAAARDSESLSHNAVFTITNAAAGNGVVSFARNADGTLTYVSTVPTGGTGTGANLGSQGAVALTENGRRLFVVNAGSNSISEL